MLTSDYKDMLSALSDASAEFLVVDAFAMAAHRCPQATGDMDVWVRPTSENAEKVWLALRSFGAPLFDLKKADLVVPGTVFQIGVRPNRIDLLTRISGVDFDEAWANRSQVIIDGMVIPVIGREELIRNKRAAGRPKDLADVAWLEQTGSATGSDDTE